MLADRTVLPLVEGWVQHGTSLLHLGTGTVLDENAVISADTELGYGELRALARRPRLSREDLVAWLASHGGLTGGVQGVPAELGWQQLLAQDGRRWVWNGPGEPGSPPAALDLGEASGQDVGSLIDSLSQLLRQILPPEQRPQMTPRYLAAWLAGRLPLDSEALPFVRAQEEPREESPPALEYVSREGSPALPELDVPEGQALAPLAAFAPWRTASAAVEAGPPDFDVVRGDMFALQAVLGEDYRAGAVVNAQNPTMLGGSGVAGLFVTHGGAALRREVMARFPVRSDGTRIGTTEAVTTHGNQKTMNALFAVHALSPVFPGTGVAGQPSEASLGRPGGHLQERGCRGGPGT